MFNKKMKIEANSYDTNFYDYWKEWQYSAECLQARVREVIVKINVVSLYPEGADRNIAEEDAYKEQKILLNYIAAYDTARNNLIKYQKENYKNLSKYQSWAREDYITSHKIIEQTYLDFSRGKLL